MMLVASLQSTSDLQDRCPNIHVSKTQASAQVGLLTLCMQASSPSTVTEAASASHLQRNSKCLKNMPDLLRKPQPF